MRSIVPFIALVVVVSGCTFNDVEPRYDSRDKFVGYYEVEEFSETYNDITFYEMRISKSGYDREVYLHNFYSADIRVYATVNYDNLRIPPQVVDGFEVEGSGTLYRGELTMNYRVKDLYEDSVTDYCETTAWRD